MAATVLASTLLLGACGNKNESTQTSSSAKTSQSSSSKAASSNKESKTQKSSSSASSEKAQASSDQSSTTADQSQAKPAPESRQEQATLVNKPHLRHLQLSKVLKPSLTSQAMIQQLTANFKTSKQNTTNATREF